MDPAITPLNRPGTPPADHRRGPSLEVLQRLHSSLRDKAASDDELIARCGNLLRRNDVRQYLGKWLRHHEGACLPDESVSDDLHRWLTDHAPDLLPGAGPVRRRDLLGRLQGELIDRAEPKPENVRALVAAGFGVVLIRYSPVLQESYYHWLLCDLLPDAVRRYMMDTLTVPEGHGTIGWVMILARAEADRDRQLLSEPEPVTLSSCFLDPRGRVATEDLLAGNRSWVGLPLFEPESWGRAAGPSSGTAAHPLGVLFCFLPLDGLFLFGRGDRAGKSKVVPFVRRFRAIALAHRRELLLALNWEAAESRRPPDGGREKLTEHATIDWIGKRLLPDQVEPNEPLGVLCLLAVEKVGDKEASAMVRLREQTLVNRIFELLQLSSIYPERWAPPSAKCLDRLREHAEQSTTIGPLLVWHRHGGRNTDLRHFYPPRTFDRDLQSVIQALDTVTPLADEGDRGQLCRRLEKALELNSPGDRVIDLLLPVAVEPHDGRRCRGVVRIKCLRPFSESATDTGPFHRLYNTVRGDAGRRWAECFARLLACFEDQISKRDLPLGRWKLYCDLRTVFCDAVAWRLTQVFRPAGRGITETSRMGLVLDAARLAEAALAENLDSGHAHGSPVFAGFADRMNACHLMLEDFCRTLDGAARLGGLPDVVLVSVWLTAGRFVITLDSSTAAPALDELLLEDHGLRDLLRTLAERPDEDTRGKFIPLSGYTHVPQTGSDADVPRVRPPALVRNPGSPAGSGQVGPSLEYQVRRGADGGPRVLTLRSHGRSWETTWEERRFPEPVAVHFVSGSIERNLFADLCRPGAFDLRSGGTPVPIGRLDQVIPEAVLRNGPQSPTEGSNALARVRAVADILSPRSEGVAGPWFAVALSARDRRGLVLAYRVAPDSPAFELTWDNARNDVQGTYSMIHQEAEVGAARKEQERLDALRHSLRNAFHRSQLAVDLNLQEVVGKVNDIRDVFRRPWSVDEFDLQKLIEGMPDLQARYDEVMGYFKYLHVLLRAVVKDDKKLDPWTTVVWDMVERLHVWLRPGYSNVTVEPRYHGDSPIAADNTSALHLFMVLANLVENAFKHTDETDGRVVLTCEPADGNHARVVIENSGPAMSESHARYLSDPNSGDPLDVTHRGLPVIIDYLQQLNLPYPKPESPIDSTQGTGTRITLTLPMLIGSGR